ncbi:hypothetical protein, partial [Kitasatospora phosalacinea]|uniref:hypothetical protein n=2 Tax=Kitasatospora phosalacinea TaxID=2065 RepID=UPI0025528074
MSVLAALALLTGAAPGVSFAAPAAKPTPPAFDRGKQIPYTRGTAGKEIKSADYRKYDPAEASKLPAAGTAVVDLSPEEPTAAAKSRASGGGQSFVRAGALPVLVRGAARGAESGAPAAGSAPKVRVELADQSVARRAGVHGVLFSVGAEGAEGGAGASATEVTVDPSSFRAAFGGDYAARLRLVRLPACVLTTPERPECQTQSPV